MYAELKNFFLELATFEGNMIQYIFNGALLGDQSITIASGSSLETLDIAENNSDELLPSEATKSFFAEVFGVVLPNQQSKVCVSLQLT